MWYRSAGAVEITPAPANDHGAFDSRIAVRGPRTRHHLRLHLRELVVLNVRVTDRGGSYATGLTAGSFRIFEEGHPQEVRFFESADAPITVGLIIDSSGSMREARDRVIAASVEFVETSNPEDEVFGLVFSDF